MAAEGTTRVQLCMTEGVCVFFLISPVALYSELLVN